MKHRLMNEVGVEGEDLGGAPPAAAGAPVSEISDSTTVFSDLAENDLKSDNGEPEIVPAADAAAPPVVVPPVAAPPIAALPPVAVPPVAPAPSAPVASEPPPATTPPVSEAPKSFQEIRKAAEEELAQMYAFTEEGKEAFAMSPETELPKLAARLYLDLHEAIFNGIVQQIPNIMQRQREVEQANSAGEKEFYGLFPKLQNETYKPTVINIIKAYRQLNPTATREQVMKAAGAMAHVTLGIPLEGEALSEAPPPSPVPFTPASPAGAPVRGPAAAPTNTFELLAVEDIALGNR